MKSITNWAFAALTLCLITTTASAALIVDDFESYANGAVIADTASSTTRTWVRFGAATATNMTATTNSSEVLSDAVSAKYGMNWTLGNNGNIRRRYDTAFDISGYGDAQVEIRALSGAAPGTTVKFNFTDGVTTWQSTAGQLLTESAQTLTFSISAGTMTRTAGSGTFAAVLAATNGLGLRFDNVGATGSTTVIVDDFVLNPVPEPAALASLLVGFVALAARRPRREIVG